jgi:pimeloyl-ACP methyl ester carboxylesterase
LATVSLLNAETTDQIHGMYMLEPYDPNKIPVVMVHGLWSSPVTWAHMFNDLRANADIHQNYQFWFYSYSTAQPFWISAMRMREDLRRIQKELDPEQQSQSLRQMVLVGHSMGGLISKMQTVASGDAFWNRVSRASLDSLTGDAATIEQVRRTFFFDPVPAVQRVVSIASPFGGSEFANNATRWFSHKLFTLPSFQTTDFERLIAGNPVAFSDPDLLTARTSIDSLSIGSPMIEALAEAEIADGVKFHNVIGVLPKKSVLGKEESGDSDGVVSVESARCVHAVSEVNVQAEHSHVHQDAACIYEVQRILLANLTQLQRIEGRQIPEIPFASRAYESPMHPLRLVPEHANRDDNQWVPPARVADRHAFDAANPMSSRRR